MPLDPAILASQQYLGLPEDPKHETRLERTLAAAVARFSSYTGRRVEPTTAATETVIVHGPGPVYRVPDLAELSAIEVVGSLTPLDPALAELVTWGASPTAVMIRLHGAPADISALRLTGQFGMDPIPADLEDALYQYAATRWREADASFGETVTYNDDQTLTLPRRLPTVVRGVWDEYRLPDAPFTAHRIVP